MAAPRPLDPLPPEGAAEPDRPEPAAAPALEAAPPEQPSRVPGWLVGVIVYVTSALAGAAIAYLVLAWLRPQHFPLPW